MVPFIGSPEGFLPLILLLVVIIARVVVTVVAVVAIGGVPSILKLLFMVIGFLNSGPRKTHVARKSTYEKFMSCHLSTSMVRKEPLVSFTSLNGLNRSTTLPSDYPFDESIFAELDNSL
uniref:Transmembrane protein n=1 Tax=Tanacetum cinerariifolium TaxID=118510 RepID=A0A699KNW5_TANCI|nr:hypothetical protein [Tanacetum cinerariifolium]